VWISPTQDFNQMSRNFSHPRTGKLCFKILQSISHDKTFKFHYELLNLDENLIVESRQLVDNSSSIWMSDEFITIAQLKAGNYQLTLKNISADTYFVRMCSGMLNFEHTPFHTNVKYLYTCRKKF
jgi:hypothetical protein